MQPKKNQEVIICIVLKDSVHTVLNAVNSSDLPNTVTLNLHDAVPLLKSVTLTIFKIPVSAMGLSRSTSTILVAIKVFNRTKASSCSILNSRTNSSHISSVNMVPEKSVLKRFRLSQLEIFGLAGQEPLPIECFLTGFGFVWSSRTDGTELPATATSYARYPVSPQSFYRSASLQV